MKTQRCLPITTVLEEPRTPSSDPHDLLEPHCASAGASAASTGIMGPIGPSSSMLSMLSMLSRLSRLRRAVRSERGPEGLVILSRVSALGCELGCSLLYEQSL